MMTAQKTHPCLHCDEPEDQENGFCCLGCKTVYHLLKDYKLDQFYKIKADSIPLAKAKPVEATGQSYHYLDTTETLEKYGQDNGQSMTFFIEGIHCNACIWLIEKLPTFSEGIDNSQVNISQNTVQIHKKDDGSFAEAARTLDRLGYKLHLNDHDTKQKVQHANTKASLTRVGIAAACSANIMIFSISIYAGLDGTLKTVFDWLSAGLMVPVLGYCSAPFFKSAYSSIKLKHMNIDIPIALALSFGSVVSLSNVILGHGDTYFDSLAMFVFLVLSVRHLFLASYQNLDYQSALSSSLIPFETIKVVGDQTQRVPTSTLKIGDIVHVPSGEVIPVDGTMNGEGYVDVHILTEESDPIKKGPGDDILAGMKNMGPPIDITVEKIGQETRLGALIQTIQSAEKPKLVLMADRVAHWFLIITISLALGLFLWHSIMMSDLQMGLQSALALIVLACPCALRLGIDHAYSNLSPEDKVAWIQKTPNVLMIGDGANDSQALLEADVSIAVQGSFESSLSASDIYFISKDLSSVASVLEVARKTKRVIWINFILSLSYNTIGITLVLLGHIHPLIAAVLMPVSSLTVIYYSWIRLKQ